MLTIDASVLIAAGLDEEAGSPEAQAFLAAAGSAGASIHEPTLAIVEVASAMARRTGRHDLVAASLGLLTTMPFVSFHPLDVEAALEAAGCATDFGIRAGDAAYMAVARATSSTLVTFDKELLACASSGLDVTTPGGWLARIAT